MALEPGGHLLDAHTEQLRHAVTRNGVCRLADLDDQVNLPDHSLRLALVRLVENGDVALFPVGDSVQVRDDTGGRL